MTAPSRALLQRGVTTAQAEEQVAVLLIASNLGSLFEQVRPHVTACRSCPPDGAHRAAVDRRDRQRLRGVPVGVRKMP